MPTILFAGIAIVFGLPLILCLNAMGRRIRADYENSAREQIAKDIGLQRSLTVRVAVLVLISLAFGRWMVSLTALVAGMAFLLPFWLNSPARADED